MPSIHCRRGLDTFGCNVAVGDAKSCSVPYPYYVLSHTCVLRHRLRSECDNCARRTSRSSDFLAVYLIQDYVLFVDYCRTRIVQILVERQLAPLVLNRAYIMEAINAANAATVDTATLAALLDGDGDGAAAAAAGAGGAAAVVAVVAGEIPVIVTPV